MAYVAYEGKSWIGSCHTEYKIMTPLFSLQTIQAAVR